MGPGAGKSGAPEVVPGVMVTRAWEIKTSHGGLGLGIVTGVPQVLVKLWSTTRAVLETSEA